MPAETDVRPAGPAFSLIVYGTPGPQGSKKPTGRYRRSKKGNLVPVLVESSAKVKPWREAIEEAARDVIRDAGRYVPLDGPLEAEMHFTLVAPKRMPKDRVAHTTYPDLSKLLRSTEDALTTAGVWADDARVIRYRALSKTYPNLGPHALMRPGVVLHVWTATP
jgi:Holliday junction resolvase RusA-like endonuclease